MRREDAPRAGWYPDPQGRDNLRYWDGLDWTEARRAPPSRAELLSYESQMAAVQPFQYTPPSVAGGSPGPRVRPTRSRSSTRSAAPPGARSIVPPLMFSERARAMRRDIEPLISQYTNRLVKWIRIAAIVAVVLLVAYFVFQVVAQASLFEWIGDRIDNLTDDQNGAALLVSR